MSSAHKATQQEEEKEQSKQLERMKAVATTIIYAADYDEMVLITRVLVHRERISEFFSHLHILGVSF